MANESVQGPIDDLVMAKLRTALLAATEPAKLAQTIPEWVKDATPAEIDVVSQMISRTLRNRLLPLVQ